MNKSVLASLLIALLLSACVVGPDYVKPNVVTPTKFKEASRNSVYKNWKLAQPNDAYNRGEWWRMFHSPQLNALEAQLNISNQSVAQAAAQHEQAQILVDQARAAYFPTVSAAATLFRQAGAASAISGNAAASTTTSTTSVIAGAVNVATTRSLVLNAAWTADIWGQVRRSVEAGTANAQASAAQLAATRLAAQAALAQYYFELRALDMDQKLLDKTVVEYKQTLQLTKNRYAAGVAQQLDVLQAQGQLETAQAQAINNQILRAQYEHAMAVLIGKPPAMFAMNFSPLYATPPKIPVDVPSILLERRPDVAQAERLMAQANAQIGIATAAYYPSLTISTFGGFQTNRGNLSDLFSVPSFIWGVGPQLAETLFDGGLRDATVAAARANYKATVASYRQTVLTAFQNVEDNLVALRVLAQESVVQNQAAVDARHALQLTINQYKAGTVPYSSVVTAQTNAYVAEKNAADVNGLRMSAAVALVAALGGGWDESIIKS